MSAGFAASTQRHAFLRLDRIGFDGATLILRPTAQGVGDDVLIDAK